eukprot:3711548-Prymnesium_polylepis.1
MPVRINSHPHFSWKSSDSLKAAASYGRSERLLRLSMAHLRFLKVVLGLSASMAHLSCAQRCSKRQNRWQT